MGLQDPRVDAYIAERADFARPILAHLRERVHAACPSAEETLKWSHPHFMYGGRILASMAAFKAHASFGFWLGRKVVETGREGDGMGQFGRLTTLQDLPPRRELDSLIRKAARLIDEDAARGTKKPTATSPGAPRRGRPQVPADLAQALAQAAPARQCFDTLSPSHQREYVEWITGAQREATRARRLEQTLQLLAQGKTLHWKYANC